MYRSEPKKKMYNIEDNTESQGSDLDPETIRSADSDPGRLNDYAAIVCLYS